MLGMFFCVAVLTFSRWSYGWYCHWYVNGAQWSEAGELEVGPVAMKRTWSEAFVIVQVTAPTIALCLLVTTVPEAFAVPTPNYSFFPLRASALH